MRLAGLALALATTSAGSAAAVPPPLGEAAYQAARERIETQQKADRQACRGLRGNARDVCRVEARGRAQAARAELQAQYQPGPHTEQAAKDARADAEYDVARERCDDAGNRAARKQCRQAAAAAREAAVRQAKVEKVHRINALEADAQDPELPEGTPEEVARQRYAAAKARCVMSGTERDSCLAEARRRFNQP